MEYSGERNQKTIFAKGEMSLYDIPVKLVYQPLSDGKLGLAWQVEIYTTDEKHYWVVKVDAENGQILDKHDLVITCTFDSPDHVHGASCNSGHKDYPDLKSLENLNETVSVPLKKNGFAEMVNGVPNFYRVYDAPLEAPSFGGRTYVSTAGDPIASPLGWHDDGITQHVITKGNNTFAYHDPGPGSTPIPAVGGTPGQGTPLNFDFDIDFSLPPAASQPAAITNLFYWNNLIHDIFYHYGFDEVSGNFQTNNLGKGGLGGDAVLAEAQDGSLVNNANFLTLPDGLPGKMQMFLWTSALPLIDGDFDNGVILHEYGHGISTRLTGGPGQTCLGGDEQGGEGWSDYFGLMVTMTPSQLPAMQGAGRGIGTYVLAEPTTGLGIRPKRYTTNMLENGYTYGDINNSEISVPHGVGFIWCTMLWEMTSKFIDLYGFDPDVVNGTGGNNIAMQLVVDALKLQPCSPTFVEMRDAILAADQINHNGAHHCLIWEAFAKRGLGYSASAGTNARGDETEAFDMPPSLCQPIINIDSAVDEILNDGQNMTITITLTNNAVQTINGITVTNELPAGTSFVSASHPASVSGNTVTFNPMSVPAGTVETITITASTNTGSIGNLVFRDDMEANPFNWTSSAGASPFTWTNAEAYSGSYSWFVLDPTYQSNQTLTLNQTIAVTAGTHLRFAHRYNTEAGFDGGVVEASTDGGATWTSVGPLFVQNGYNDFIPLANNPLIAGTAFGGSSNGYLISMADLSPLAGQDVAVRFRFSADVFSGGEGWYVDNVEIVNDPTIAVNTASFSMANGFITGSDTQETLIVSPTSQAMIGNPNLNQFDTEEAFESDFTIALAPNPANDFVQLSILGKVDGTVKIDVLNLQGQVLQNQILDTTEFGNTLEMNASDLNAGIYLVRVQDGSQTRTTKLIIQ
ncbi:MAG: T9SS C-terminal target domain-containing protein [Bacteroidetes bacterium]|nr:MAG: T9SS C-terminal target domain-containing protein [Bacteroidota bacterium]